MVCNPWSEWPRRVVTASSVLEIVRLLHVVSRLQSIYSFSSPRSLRFYNLQTRQNQREFKSTCDPLQLEGMWLGWPREYSQPHLSQKFNGPLHISSRLQTIYIISSPRSLGNFCIGGEQRASLEVPWNPRTANQHSSSTSFTESIYTVEPLYKHPVDRHTWLISIQSSVPIEIKYIICHWA